MVHRPYHVFLSYARKDNLPRRPGGEGWVSAFKREIEARHQQYSGRDLRVFLDTSEIDEGDIWKRRLGTALRSSHLFLAFLSSNYIASRNCLWEWEEYLRHEHSAARGDDGITPIYFVMPDDLSAGDDTRLASWLGDLNRRNRTYRCELYEWFDRGPEILRRLDTAERLGDLKAAPREQGGDARDLEERLIGLDRRIAARLDRLALADLAPGNVVRSYEHFVGRHRELSELHDHLVMGRRGLIAAAHGLGGQGKTALARQYSHAYAEFYAAGGTWELPCEGQSRMGDVLARLADERTLGLTLSDIERADTMLAARAVLHHLEQFTRSRATLLRGLLQRHPDRHSPEATIPVFEQPRCLLIFDNVDRPELFSASQIALLPAEDWLEILVTTREDPNRFGAGERWQAPVHVDELPPADALALLADFQPGRRFATSADEEAARELVAELGGYTLAVELIAAYLGAHPDLRPADYLVRLRLEGVTHGDDPALDAEVDSRLVHDRPDLDPKARLKKKQLALILADTLGRLRPPARTALEFASLLLPDRIPLDWLRAMTLGRHTEEFADRPGQPPGWPEVWRELQGRRLLLSAEGVEVDERGVGRLPAFVRLHRLVAEHVRAALVDRVGRLDDLERFLVDLATWLEGTWSHTPSALWQHTALRDNLGRFLDTRPTRPVTLSAQVSADIEGTVGRLDLALALFQRTYAILEQLLQANPQSAEAARDVSVSLNLLADCLARRGQEGDAATALGYYERSLAVLDPLLEANPQSAEAARDVSVSLIKLADFLVGRGREGDAATALAHYERSLAVREPLLEANPRSGEAARDVSVSLDRLGDFLEVQGQEGDAATALGYCERSLALREPLLEANPRSAEAARGVSVSLIKLADSLARRGQEGDAATALGYYKRSLAILEPLLEANPQSAQAARDVSVNRIQLADFLVGRGQEGDAATALTHYERSLAVCEPLLEANPQSAQAARDVSVSLIKLADFLAGRGQEGDAATALGHYERSLAVLEPLLEANPQSAQAARDVLVSLERMAQAVGGVQAADAARRALGFQRRALEIALRLQQNNRQSGFYGRTAAVSAYLAARFSNAAGEQGLEAQYLAGCHRLLRELVESRAPLDSPMVQLYERLSGRFGGPT